MQQPPITFFSQAPLPHASSPLQEPPPVSLFQPLQQLQQPQVTSFTPLPKLSKSLQEEDEKEEECNCGEDVTDDWINNVESDEKMFPKAVTLLYQYDRFEDVCILHCQKLAVLLGLRTLEEDHLKRALETLIQKRDNYWDMKTD